MNKYNKVEFVSGRRDSHGENTIDSVFLNAALLDSYRKIRKIKGKKVETDITVYMREDNEMIAQKVTVRVGDGNWAVNNSIIVGEKSILFNIKGMKKLYGGYCE